MRRIVLQMMTTVNGRLDDPMAWVQGVGADQYGDIDRLYERYDTVLVGRTTYEEMAAYWPQALADGEGPESHRSMARRMNAYRKIVFSRSGREAVTEWANTERVVVAHDGELADCLADLKAQPGADIHLAGGASLAQAVIGLGLVDEYRFFVYPIVSPGVSWFGALREAYGLELGGATTYERGVLGVHYRPLEAGSRTPPESFSELLG